jgi:hypothetical protein
MNISKTGASFSSTPMVKSDFEMFVIPSVSENHMSILKRLFVNYFFEAANSTFITLQTLDMLVFARKRFPAVISIAEGERSRKNLIITQFTRQSYKNEWRLILLILFVVFFGKFYVFVNTVLNLMYLKWTVVIKGTSYERNPLPNEPGIILHPHSTSIPVGYHLDSIE